MEHFFQLIRQKSIEWSKLKHAYGFADDVPGKIHSLRSPHYATRQEAIQSLKGNIWHQGTRYEATPFAIPFLAELLDEKEVLDKDEIIYLLISIAIGYDDSYLPKGINSEIFRKLLKKHATPLSISAKEVYDDWGLAPFIELLCYDFVGKLIPKFLNLLPDEDYKVQLAACYALTWFPESGETTIPILLNYSEGDYEGAFLATVIMTLGILAANSPVPLEINWINRYLGSNSAIIRIAAAIAITNNVQKPDIEVIKIILESYTTLDELVEESARGFPFGLGDIRTLLLLTLENNCSEFKELIVPELCKLLPQSDVQENVYLTNAILNLVLVEEDKPLNPSSKLTKLQKAALQAIANDGRLYLGFLDVISGFGLPSTLENLREFLMDK